MPPKKKPAEQKPAEQKPAEQKAAAEKPVVKRLTVEFGGRVYPRPFIDELTMRDRFAIRAQCEGMPAEQFFPAGTKLTDTIGRDMVAVWVWMSRRHHGEPDLPLAAVEVDMGPTQQITLDVDDVAEDSDPEA